MNVERLLKKLRADEGLELKPYTDSLGHWTIGYGATTILGVPVTEHTKPITKKQAEWILMSHAMQAIADAQTYFPDLFNIDAQKAEVLICLAFQLGLPKLNQFKKLKFALEHRDWKMAADSLRNSLLYRQAMNRTERHAKILE